MFFQVLDSGSGGGGDPDSITREFSSTSEFQSFLSDQRSARGDTVSDAVEPKRVSVLDDGGVLGTSRQTAFSLGHRHAQDSVIAKAAYTVVDYFSEGVLTLVILSVLKYVMVAVIHVLFYEYIPELGMFVREIDWDTAFLLMNFVVGFIIQGDIRDAVSRFSQHPYAAFRFYRYMIHSSRDLCGIYKGYRETEQCMHNNNSPEDIKVITHAFVEIQHDIVRMTRMVIGFFQEMETRGDRVIQDMYEERVAKFFQRLAILRRCGVISPQLEIHYRDGIQNQLEPTMTQSGFSKRFIPSTLVSNHLRLVIFIYLWGFVPIQLYASLGLMVIAVYPMMMLIFDMVKVLDHLQGQAFAFRGGQYHPNDYRKWEDAALSAIYNACIDARVDGMHVHDIYQYGGTDNV